MKVALFCGGMGTRLREHEASVPKPMVSIGPRPILWNVMKYYAHFGHKDFILCLGHRGEYIKEYFLKYDECMSNDFVLSHGGSEIHLLNSDIQDWKITFADTGMSASIGQRLKAVEPYLRGEEVFLANYSDGVTDLHLPAYVDWFLRSGKIGGFLSVKSPQSFHVVSVAEDGAVSSIGRLNESDVWINGGFFIFRREIFEYIEPGDDLVGAPFQRLIAERELIAYPYRGFWAAMDTFKDRQWLQGKHEAGEAPWELWRRDQNSLPAEIGER